MEKRMDFQASEIREPNEGGLIVDEDVADVSARRFAAWHRHRLDPLWAKSRSIFLVKRFTENAVRKALESDGTILQMRKQKLRNAGVIIDDLRLRELLAWVKNFVEVGGGNPLTANAQLFCLPF